MFFEAGMEGRGWIEQKLILDAELVAVRVVEVEDEVCNVAGDWDTRESKFGGGILAP